MDARGVVMAQVGRNMRALREELGMSQERLAVEANLDRTYVSQVERGRRNISVVNICRLAYVLKVPPGVFLEGVEWVREEEHEKEV
jgi:transcriptional regulator with XRE-family HTH domain